MRIWIMSDLHLEHSALPPMEPPRADVCVVAGDVLTHGAVPSVRWLAENICPLVPVVFVCGNHEFYGGFLTDGIQAARDEAARHPRLHLLEQDVVEIGGVLFAGTTMWTDFSLFVDTPKEIAMRHSREVMWDYSRIKLRKRPFEALRPVHTLRAHKSALAFLGGFLTANYSLRTVVVTHHAPSPRSIPDEFRVDLASAAYASNLEDLIESTGPSLWIHGHVNRHVRYTLGHTEVICNSRGYLGETSFEDFDQRLVIEV
jgi:Icc-related predicted phosphoesterase